MSSTTFSLLHAFLFSLSFGSQLYTPVVKTKLTGAGFFKLITSISLTSLILSFGLRVVVSGQLSLIESMLHIGLIGSLIFAYIFHRDDRSLGMWILYVAQMLGFICLSFQLYPSSSDFLPLFFSSMMLLGIANYSMLLGHYYLVVPKLSEQPLIYCLYIFWAILIFKCLNSLSVIIFQGSPFLTEGSSLGDGYLYNWIFISMRYLWGMLAPLILSFFTFRLCQLRSIQSATGVLYIIEFFIIVGELISLYIKFNYGLSL